jgi:tetratricopeptide (TPR) repeat protein
MPSRQPFHHNAPNPAARALAEAKAHHQAGRLPKAERLYRVALNLRVGDPETLFYLGNVLREQGNDEAALECYAKALEAYPEFPEAYVNMSVCWCNLGNLEKAIPCLEEAVRLRPDFAEALSSLGNVLREQGNHKAALTYYQRAIEINTANPDAYVDIGSCWYDAGDLEQAVHYFEKALGLKPDHVEALGALSDALLAMGRSTEARATLDRALQLAPDNAEIIARSGKLFSDEGKIDEALTHYERSLARAPTQQMVRWNKALALLAMGQYREGWRFFEAGLGRRHLRGLNPFASAKPWGGEPALDKHLLIWSEQGFGDSLQFIRYGELCRQRVGKVSVLCPKPLVRLFKALPFIDDAFDATDGKGFDELVPMMSLPHLFDTTLETVPAAVPYLRVEADIQAEWALKLAGSVGVKVGLVWAGSARESNLAANRIDRQRSVGLERMKPWLGLQGVHFYNLQKDKPAEQIAALGLQDRITDFMGEVEDFADTAAIIQNLDLVITVDTSVAHLAGGLGKPVWILSRYNACWRWLQNRPTSPWYPTARIFGQPSMGDWDSVIAEVGRELALEIAKRAH